MRLLQRAGASLIAVHGRTRDQKGREQGGADWSRIAQLKQCVSVPVLANGGIFSLRDAHRCILKTGVDGVMSGVDVQSVRAQS